MRASAVIPGDSALSKLWPRFADTFSVLSHPPGARVYRRNYSAPNAGWTLLGTTPLTATRFPFRLSRIRLEMDGRQPLDAAVEPFGLARTGVRAERHGRGQHHGARARRRGRGRTPRARSPRAGGAGRFSHRPLRGDQSGSTSGSWRRGGYRRKELWTQPFIAHRPPAPWNEAIARFTDRTGRPGPATWEGGSYPAGQANYPVTGVSWYEAAAYAAFAGAALPTIYHWSRAAFTWAGAAIVPLSNFAGRGLAPVGRYQGVGPFGTSDMAGNAREWCLNAGGHRAVHPGRRLERSDLRVQRRLRPGSLRSVADQRLPRGEIPLGHNLATAGRPMVRLFRDFAKVRPVPDQVFAAYRRMYDYDATLLAAGSRRRDSSRGLGAREDCF